MKINLALGKIDRQLCSYYYFSTVYKKVNNEAIKDLSILYLDFAKVFDNVPHNILMQKLYNIGVGGKLIQLISSYLTNRK